MSEKFTYVHKTSRHLHTCENESTGSYAVWLSKQIQLHENVNIIRELQLIANNVETYLYLVKCGLVIYACALYRRK